MGDDAKGDGKSSESGKSSEDTHVVSPRSSPVNDVGGLPYLDSQEPIEESERIAFTFLDDFVKGSTDCSSDKSQTKNSSDHKSKPASSAKGSQILAKRFSDIDKASGTKVFEWDGSGDDVEEEPEGTHKSQIKEKRLIIGDGTKQSSSKKIGQNQTHDIVPVKQDKSAAQTKVLYDVSKRQKLAWKTKEVSVHPKSVKTRHSMRKVKDPTKEINIPARSHPKSKRTRQEVVFQSITRLTRSKAAVLNEYKQGTCAEEGSPRAKNEPIPVTHGTAFLKEASPIIKGDEYLKRPLKKTRLRCLIIQEQQPHCSLTPTRMEFAFPTKNTRKRKDTPVIRVLFSSHLDPDILKQQKEILSRLRGSEVSSMSDATHFIANEFVRTRNMLEAIAYGKPVVTHSWLKSCGQAHRHIDEAKFILTKFEKEAELGFSLPASLAHAQKNLLLKGYRVWITLNTKPGMEILASLVKAVGGVMVGRLSRIADDKTPTRLIVSCEEDYALCLPFLEKGLAVYSSELLLNGIVTQRLDYERLINYSMKIQIF